MPLYGSEEYQSYQGVYGGEKLQHPEIGSWVVIRVGPFSGSAYKVVSLRGHAFHQFYRVYVDHPDVEGLWFWPWEVEEWPELGPNGSPGP